MNRALSGQALDGWKRTRRLLRTITAPIFNSFRRMVPAWARAISVPARARRRMVSGSLFANDGEVLCAAAVAGLGLVLAPEWLVGIELRRGALREVLPQYRAVPATTLLYAVYPHQRHLPPKVRAFIDFLAQRFAVAYAWDARY